MRLAALADIHGCLPALEAVLNDAEKHSVDGFIVAGDMVSSPNSGEVIERLRGLECWMILGNNEQYLLQFDSGDAPEWWHTSYQWSFTRWCYKHTNRKTLDFIRSLPEQRAIDIPGAASIRVVHGSPRNISELVYPDKDPTLLEIALSQTSESLLIFGHTHVPWQMQRNGRLALNPGAVCGSFAGKKCGSYALLTWQNQRWETEPREIYFDFEKVRAAFRDTGLLEGGGVLSRVFLKDIETGENTLPVFVDYAYRMAADSGYPDCEFVPNEVWCQAAKSFGL